MAEPTNDPTPDAPPADPKPDPTPESGAKPEPDGDKGKGSKDAVLADLAKERDRRQALEQQVNELLPLKEQFAAIAKVFGGKDDESADPAKLAEQLAESQRTATENAAALIRYKTAIEKQVPAHLMEFVGGSTAEEVEASIEKVLAAFSSSKPTGPKPDPSQGDQGAPTSLDAQIAEAEAKGDVRTAIRLKARKGMTTN
jgi:hypothetical protein